MNQMQPLADAPSRPRWLRRFDRAAPETSTAFPTVERG